MQEDKQLQDLLKSYAVETPAADFTAQVMQQVAALDTAAVSYPSLFKQTVPKVLLAAFTIVCITLLLLSFKMPAATVPFLKSVGMPASYFSQGLSFLVAFWTVMLSNIAYEKYVRHSAIYNQ